jgi:hypothetical protein
MASDCPSAADQPLDVDGFQRQTEIGEDPGLNPPRRADEEDLRLGIDLLQPLRQGHGREEMSAGSATGQKHPHCTSPSP